MPTTVEQGLSFATYTQTDGANTDFVVPFPFLDPSYIYVGVNEQGVTQGVNWNFVSGTPSLVRFVTAPASGASVKVYRRTPFNKLFRTWQDGAVLTASDINSQNTQVLHVIQEIGEISLVGLTPGAGLPPIYIVIEDPTDPNTVLPPGLTKNDFDVYRNGILIHPDDYDLAVDGSETTLEFNIGFDADEVIILRLRRGSATATLDLASVTTGAIADGAVTGDKIADDSIRYKHLAVDTPAALLASPQQTDGVGNLLANANARIAALEAGSGGSVQLARTRFAYTPSATATFTHSFAFTPDFVLVSGGYPETLLSPVTRNIQGFSCVCPQGGTQHRVFLVRDATDDFGVIARVLADSSIPGIALSGSTVTVRCDGGVACVVDVIAVKL